MTPVVVDANVLIDALRGRDAAHDALRRVRHRRGELVSPTTTRSEVLAGLRPGEGRQALWLIDWIADLETDVAGEYARRHKSSHWASTSPITCSPRRQTSWWKPVTLNVRHFLMFLGSSRY
jgi:predicted nucleic acid-binding protein